MAHSHKPYDDQVLYDVSTGGNLLWDMAKGLGKQMVHNVWGATRENPGPGSLEALYTPVPQRKRGEPPFQSLVKAPERSVKSTSTEGQKRRWGQQAARNKQAAQRGLSARRNAADISMNNPPVVTDASGHRVYNGKRVHR